MRNSCSCFRDLPPLLESQGLHRIDCCRAARRQIPAQQVAIGFSGNGVFATYGNPITACSGVGKSTLLTLPQTGAANDDHNPDRGKARNLFNVGIGTDNLFHKEQSGRVTVRFAVENLTNKVTLYNFLSTFSGTHFVPPRTYQVSLGYAF
jgi:outer membrane receptor protein involved in Fe transport